MSGCPTRCRPRCSRGPSTCCCTSSCASRSTSTRCRCRPSSTPTSPSSTQLEQLDLEVATEFLLIAATLVELKAKRLLPDESDLDLDDELALWEERDLLLARLLECKTFKDASLVLQRLSVEAARSYPRTAGLEDRFLDAHARSARGRHRRRPRASPYSRAADAPAGADGRDRPHPRRAGQRDRRGRGAARRAAPRWAASRSARSPSSSSSGSRSSCASSPCSSCSSRASSTSTRPRAFGDIQILWLGDRGRWTTMRRRRICAAIDVYEG